MNDPFVGTRRLHDLFQLEKGDNLLTTKGVVKSVLVV
jgi:hypothetical protein